MNTSTSTTATSAGNILKQKRTLLVTAVLLAIGLLIQMRIAPLHDAPILAKAIVEHGLASENSPLTDPTVLIMLALIYTVAAVLSGLSGFGFSAVGALTLVFLPPTLAISMLMMLSICTQATSFGSLWKDMRQHSMPLTRKDGVLPYCAGGILGMPLGLKVMVAVASKLLVGVFGALLVIYSAYSLLKPATMRLKNETSTRFSSFVVGTLGGIVGGFTAFPGCAMVVWNGLKNTPKEHARALTQPFVLFMQFVGLALLSFARPQNFNAQFWALFAIMLPLALCGSFVGVAVYRRTSLVNYRKITFCVLGLSGLGLLVKLALV